MGLIAAGGAMNPPLSAYRFVASSSSVLKGMFLDENGFRVGDLFSGVIDNLSLASFADIAGSLPTDAVAVAFVSVGEVKMVLTDKEHVEPSLADALLMGISYSAGSQIVLGRIA